ncbi:MAG: hypothetical protein HDS61_04395 [Barnesiella sp.]|nr:hypothetical protein [Barnesiella sp.]
MKILELRDFGNDGNRALPSLILTTDSSVVRDNRPVFLPEISKRWRCDISAAFLISRLGKSIAERFAPRYYDMMTLCARLVPLDIVMATDGSEQWTPWATAFDGALAIGTWTDAAAIKTVDITSPRTITLSNVATPIAKSIKLLSKDMIIKTGDIIIPPAPIFSCDINIGDRVEAAVNGQPILSFNIK